MIPRTVIIAEIGENHAGDWALARRMVVEAARAGADIVKFQSYRAGDVAEDDPEKEWFARVELPDSVHREMAALAEEHGVEFLSSPFTLERARFLCEGMGMRAVKIASSEMTNGPLLDYVAEKARTVYLSTGMATLEEIRRSVARLKSVPRVVVMHCVTQYPLRDEDANLRAIELLRKEFPDHPIGYSDHTVGLAAPLLAVALGACVIEKHFTLDRRLPGTDHELSLLPAEWETLVSWIRRSEQLLGWAQKEPVEAERAIREAVRRRFAKTP